jgi:hypothetical protein
LHAAAALARGQVLADARLADAIGGPAQDLRQAIQSTRLPRDQIWRQLLGLSTMVDSLRDLAERAAARCVGAAAAERAASFLLPPLGAIESAVRSVYPNLLAELALRERPLREQWEARGPGLLRSIARWTDPRLMPAEAKVVLIHPALGGGGTAHLAYNLVHIESVLTNPVPQLPEVLRLGWLLAQLNLDLPVFSDSLHGSRLALIAELAMLPATLQAAEDVELATNGPESIDLALQTWNVMTPPEVDPVDVVWRWWCTYLETRPRWDIAFTALDRMVSGESAA